MNSPDKPEATDYALHHPSYRELLNVLNEKDGSMQINLIEPSTTYAADSLAFLADPDVGKYTGMDYSNLSLEGERERLQKIVDNVHAYHWMIEVNGRVIGNININEMDISSKKDQCRSGWMAITIGDKTLWGRGLGRSLVRAVCNWAFQEAAFDRLNAHIREENLGSMKSFTANGFTLTDSEDEEDKMHPGKTVRWNNYALMKEHVL